MWTFEIWSKEIQEKANFHFRLGLGNKRAIAGTTAKIYTVGQGAIGVVSNKELLQEPPQAAVGAAAESLHLLRHSFHGKVLGVEENGHHAAEALPVR